MNPPRIVTAGARRPLHARIESWLVSVIVHTFALLILGLWVLPGVSGRVGESLQFRIASTTTPAVELTVLKSPDRSADARSESDVADRLATVSHPPQPILAAVTTDAFVPTGDQPLDGSLTALLRPNGVRATTHLRTFDVIRTRMPRSASDPANAIRQADGISDAVGMVTDSIGEELARGDTLIVWLLDASISLELHRETMARRAAAFYKSIGGLTTRDSGSRNLLFSSVVGFGERAFEVLRPTPVGAKAICAIGNVPRDTTGTENVMAGIRFAVRLYRTTRHRDERMIVVVLTDEAGDDTRILESSIQECRDAQVAVHVISATSVLGIQQGIQHCVIKQNDVDYSFWLDVKKGPESLLPQRFYVPYWHESTLPPWKSGNAHAVENSPWYGGPYRERVLSGFGPYALTRLALQTGGKMTLFDYWPVRRGQFDIEKLRPYTPDYRPTNQYLSEVSNFPLRRFVSEAAELSFQYSELFLPPRMTFIGVRSAVYPYDVKHQYFPPAEFRRHMNAALRIERDRIEMARAKLMELTRRFRHEEIDWSGEYERDESRRWQACYDLTKGRLLSTLSLYDEYLAATRAVAPSLGSSTNAVLLTPTDSTRMASSAQMIEQVRSI